MFKSTNHLLVVRRPCLNAGLVRRQMANCTGKALHLWLNDMAVNRLLSNVEHSQRLHKVEEQRILCESLASTNASTKTEDKFTRVSLRLVPRAFQMSFGPELIGLWVDTGVVGKPPAIARIASVYDQAGHFENSPNIGQDHCVFWNAVSSIDGILVGSVG